MIDTPLLTLQLTQSSVEKTHEKSVTGNLEASERRENESRKDLSQMSMGINTEKGGLSGGCGR